MALLPQPERHADAGSRTDAANPWDIARVFDRTIMPVIVRVSRYLTGVRETARFTVRMYGPRILAKPVRERNRVSVTGSCALRHELGEQTSC